MSVRAVQGGGLWTCRVRRVAALALCAALGIGGCSRERDAAERKLTSPRPLERAEGVKELALLVRHDDEAGWGRIERLTRDPVKEVRIAAAQALSGAPRGGVDETGLRRAMADEALALLLADPDDGVRSAAARTLGERCNERTVAWLHGAMGRSGAVVREVVAQSLCNCGLSIPQILRKVEELRRRRALDRISALNGAQRASAVRELGVLGRAEDVATLFSLLGDEDGFVVAAAALALGHAGALQAAPMLAKLAADEQPLVAASAAQGLLELGPEAVQAARAVLEKRAVEEGEPALPAALGLATIAQEGLLCGLAHKAREGAAAAVLARGCPSGPLGVELSRATRELRQAKASPLALRKHVLALLEALTQTKGALTVTAGAALGDLATLPELPVAQRAIEVAQATLAVGSGPGILAAAVRAKAALLAERAAADQQREHAGEDDEGVARELMLQAARAPAADREKVARLLELVRQRDQGREARQGAREHLDDLLRGSATPVNGKTLLAAALRALLALRAKGASELAKSLQADVDPRISSAARGLPGVSERHGGAERGGVPVFNEAFATTRLQLWSDHGPARAAACKTLASRADASSEALRLALASADPERAVRSACAAKNETQAHGKR